MSFPSPAELHLLYVLTDSALPTGGFVASSGLESYAKHGFLASSPSFSTNLGPPSVTRGVTDFARAEVENFASTSIGFVVHSFRLVSDFLDDAEHSNDNTSEPKDEEGASGVEVEDVIEKLVRLDGYHEATLLSHVARRSSKSQGVALLTLYTRGLGPPPGCESPAGEQGREGVERRARVMVDGYKRLIRSGVAPGHLAVCWGVITAALGLSLDRALHLYLFLHARSVLSSAVRLNLIGPYASSQLLLHPFRDIIERETERSLDRPAGVWETITPRKERKEAEADGDDFWEWADDSRAGPTTTWSLGEVLMSRHDLQHSRIFNS